MSYPTSPPATSRSWASWIPSGALATRRFVLHYVEMVLAMYAGMLIYMPFEGLLPGSLQQIGMALFMSWPMVVWMRIRGHAWRHSLEMAAAMLIPWTLLSILAAVIPPLATVADWSMYLGMLGFMLIRRDHHHAGMREHAEPHSTPRSARQRRIDFRPILLAVAYVTVVVLVPTGAAVFNIGSKWSAQDMPVQVPAITAPLPPLPVPDPSKKIAVVLSSAYGAEITTCCLTSRFLPTQARSTSTPWRLSGTSYRW